MKFYKKMPRTYSTKSDWPWADELHSACRYSKYVHGFAIVITVGGGCVQAITYGHVRFFQQSIVACACKRTQRVYSSRMPRRKSELMNVLSVDAIANIAPDANKFGDSFSILFKYVFLNYSTQI